MSPEHHRVEAERLLGQADELRGLLEEGVNSGEVSEADAMRQYPEVTMLAQLASAHALLSWESPPALARLDERSGVAE